MAAHFSAINNEAVKAKEVQDAAILQIALEEADKKKAAEGEAAAKKKTNLENEVVPTLFDYQYYGANNQDVVDRIGSTKEALIAHYTAYGFAEGRSPNKENTNTDNSLLDTLYITKYNLDDKINNLSENAIKVYIEYHKATRNGFQDKAEFDEAAKKKAADEKAANDKSRKVINTADVAGDNTAINKLLQSLVHYGKVPSQFESIRKEITKLNTNDKVNNGTENAEAYVTIDLNNTLKKMNFDVAVMNKLSVIKNIKIKKLIDQTKMKTINLQGIIRTMYCKPKCTLGSPMLQSNSTGIDIGIPLVVYDGISEAINNTLGRVNPLKRNDIIKLGISSYKEVATTINDPNINKALAMPIEQLKQIKTLQRQIQASRKKRSERSSGSAEGHDHDHYHEEEDWRTVPGSIYYD